MVTAMSFSSSGDKALPVLTRCMASMSRRMRSTSVNATACDVDTNSTTNEESPASLQDKRCKLSMTQDTTRTTHSWLSMRRANVLDEFDNMRKNTTLTISTVGIDKMGILTAKSRHAIQNLSKGRNTIPAQRMMRAHARRATARQKIHGIATARAAHVTTTRSPRRENGSRLRPAVRPAACVAKMAAESAAVTPQKRWPT
mmetsp:Transcript_71657/g.207531  ORF Transcript_71657/g.207531 Transcript_71657/m.207531 type:complete len:200 (-) Transcript_71657:236-835(-)